MRRETVRDDMAMVKRSPVHMTRVLARTLVTARVEQIPRVCRKRGFSFQNPLRRISLFDGVGIAQSPSGSPVRAAERKAAISLLRKRSTARLVSVAPVTASSSPGPDAVPAGRSLK